MKNIKPLIFLIPITIFALFEISIRYPSTSLFTIPISENSSIDFRIFYIFIFLSLFLLITSINYIIKNIKITKEKWKFTILPSCFFLSLSLYSLIITNSYLMHFLISVNSFFIYFYLRNVYLYLIHSHLYKKDTMENISSYGNFLAIFFYASFIYALQSFLNISVWFLLSCLIPIVCLATYQVIWANNIDFKSNILFLFVVYFLFLEIALVIFFFPFNFNVLGLAFTICYYMLMGLTKFHLKRKLSSRIFKLYLLFGLVSLALIFLTAKI